MPLSWGAAASRAPAPRLDPRKAEFEANKLRKRLRRQVGEAIGAYGLIEPHDRVMVCVSGGKDSYGLLDILLTLKGRAPFPFEVIAMNLDQKQPDFPAEGLPRFFDARDIPYRIVEQDTYSVVKRVIPEGGTLCSLCSRLRRGVIYRTATELGATKIALGHHRDDVLATFFLNLFFGGKLKTMPPKLVSDDGGNVVIRPLVHVRERDLARYAELNEFPDHSLQSLRIAGSTCSASRSRHAARVGEESTRDGSTRSSARSATSCRRTSWIAGSVRLRRRQGERHPHDRRRHRSRRGPGARARDGGRRIRGSRSTPSRLGALPTNDRCGTAGHRQARSLSWLGDCAGRSSSSRLSRSHRVSFAARLPAAPKGTAPAAQRPQRAAPGRLHPLLPPQRRPISARTTTR
jgi:hypothetical protein